MPTLSLSTTCTDSSSLKMSCTAEVVEESIDTANNLSNCKVTFKAIQNPDKNWGFTGTTRPQGGYLVLYVEGYEKGRMNVPVTNSSSSTATTTTGSSTFTIGRNADGTRTVNIQLKMLQGVPPTGNVGYLWKAAASSSQSWTLQTISQGFNLWYNDGGTQRKAKKVFYNDSGTWREAKNIFYNDGGTWRQCKKG